MTKKDFSKHCIADALIDLLSTKHLSEISIQEVVDKAGFSRMAYYRNFSSLENVVEYYVESMISDFYEKTKISYQNMGMKLFFLTFFNYLYEEKTRSVLKILKDNGLIGVFTEQCRKEANNGFIAEKDKALCDFAFGGIFSDCLIWLRNGCVETPEEMAEKETKALTALISKA